MHRSLPLTALLAAASLATAAPASAATYEATVEVDYAYEIDHREELRSPTHTRVMNRHAAFTGHLRSVNAFVSFREGRVEPYRAGLLTSWVTTLGSGTETVKDDWSGDGATVCTAAEGTYTRGRTSFAPLTGGIGVRLLDELEIPLSCGGAAAGGSVTLKNTGVTGDDDDYVGPFDTVATLPAGALGADRIQLVLDRPATDVDHCPGEDDSGTITRCRFSYTGTLTLNRQDLATGDGDIRPGSGTPADPPAPAPKPTPVPVPAPTQPAPAPAPEPTSSGSLGDKAADAIEAYLRDAKVSVTRKGATVDVTCAGPCTGTISATAVALENSRRGTPLGRTVFHDLASSRAVGSARAATPHRMRATLRFDAKDRRALGTKRRVRLTLTLKAGRETAARTVTARVRR